MIDIFNELYTLFVDTLLAYDNKIETGGVYTNAPSKYPFASLEEIDNAVYELTSDSCDIENHAEVEYEVNIYTQNKLKKSKGDGIAQVVDNLFKSLGFIRMSRNVLQSQDETTYRIILRYRGVVSKEKVIYRR